jgi:hypothetical protein
MSGIRSATASRTFIMSPSQQWVPVTEQLPPSTQKLWLWDAESGEARKGGWIGFGEDEDGDLGEWIDESGAGIVGDITHWMVRDFDWSPPPGPTES